MKAGLTITGIKKVNDRLRALAAKHGQGKPIVAVGYSAAYALYVHENREMKWRGLPRGAGFTRGSDPGVVFVPKKYLNPNAGAGQGPKPRRKAEKKAGRRAKGFYWDPQGRGKSKFLEDPARDLQQELGRIVAEALLQGADFATAMLRAGLRLQRESMLQVPVDTGNLKASAFTKLEFESFTMDNAFAESAAHDLENP